MRLLTWFLSQMRFHFAGLCRKVFILQDFVEKFSLLKLLFLTDRRKIEISRSYELRLLTYGVQRDFGLIE